jgi:pyruvate kinase
LAVRLEELRDEMRARYVESEGTIGRAHGTHVRSAHNLVDYLTLRSHDLRPIQESLAELGVSSLGRSEEHVISSVERVIEVLHALCGRATGRITESAVDFSEGRLRLHANAAALLGARPPGRHTRIMVTMPTEAARDGALTSRLISAGMDCARINGAHDGPEEWAGMADNIARAARDAGGDCPILFDLPGPKLRTGPVAPGPKVVRLRPRRDARGVAMAPARARLVAEMPAADGRAAAGTAAGTAGETAEDTASHRFTPVPPAQHPVPAGGVAVDRPEQTPALPVPSAWLRTLRAGDRLFAHDTRGSARVLEVTATGPSEAWVAVWDTAYLATGTQLAGPNGSAAIGQLPPVEQALRVHVGDVVVLTSDLAPAEPGVAAPLDNAGGGEHSDRGERFTIGCTLPEALACCQAGHRVWFDDGRIGGVVRAAAPGLVEVQVTVAAPGGANLKGGRGINLPDTELVLPPVRAEDAAQLAFAVARADVVGMSFAQRPEDVLQLQRQLHAMGRPDVGIMLKIETATGFHRLPELILAGMASERLGVMVARGDLAVECGFERLAEVQEEILWLCDAAHVPVVWATEVLDNMARTGRPSRAEVSDAVMAARAECVMLNKGPHITEAVAALDDILCRMEGHQHKKVPLLRPLRSWSEAR